MKALEVGRGECIKQGTDLAILTIGTMAQPAITAISAIETEYEISISHYDLRFLKPLDQNMLHEIGRKFTKIITIEDGVINGGFGSAVLEFFSDNGYTPSVKRLGISDMFVEHGTPDELYHILGLDAKGISTSIIEFTGNLKIRTKQELITT